MKRCTLTAADRNLIEESNKERTKAPVKIKIVIKNPVLPKQENVRAILLDEVQDKLSGIRIPYKEKEQKDIGIICVYSNFFINNHLYAT